MTDAQFAALLAVIGGGLSAIAAAIRWSIRQLAKAFDRGTKAVERSTDALIGNTASNATLSAKVDGISVFVTTARKAPSRSEVEGLVKETVEKEISGVHDAPDFDSRTAPRGYRPPGRPGTSGGK